MKVLHKRKEIFWLAKSFTIWNKQSLTNNSEIVCLSIQGLYTKSFDKNGKDKLETGNSLYEYVYAVAHTNPRTYRQTHPRTECLMEPWRPQLEEGKLQHSMLIRVEI